MDVLDLTKQLGEGIAASDEYVKMQAAQDAVTNDQTASQLLVDYQEKRKALQECMSQAEINQEFLKTCADEISSLEKQLYDNPLTAEMIRTQMDFQNLMSKVNALLKFYVTGEVSGEGSCGGDCSGCSGCH